MNSDEVILEKERWFSFCITPAWYLLAACRAVREDLLGWLHPCATLLGMFMSQAPFHESQFAARPWGPFLHPGLCVCRR